MRVKFSFLHTVDLTQILCEINFKFFQAPHLTFLVAEANDRVGGRTLSQSVEGKIENAQCGKTRNLLSPKNIS